MASKNEAKIKFTAETGAFNDQIKKTDSTLQEMRSELKLNASQMKKTGDNTKTLKERQEILRKELDVARQKTQALNDKLEKAKEIFGENSEEVRRLQTQLNNAKTVEQKIADEIEDTNTQLKKQKTALHEVADKADKVGDKLTKLGKGMSVVSAGIVAAGTAAVAAFNQVDEGADNVIKATGATGAAAEELEAAYSNVASQIVGDFGDLGSAVGEINTRFGYTGEKLEGAALSFAKFSEITGVDTTEAVRSVARALNDSGIPLDEYDTLLDQLAKAGQAAGIDVTTLADSLSKNGAVMRGMGFDTADTIALLAQFEVSGADASTMLTGMKRAMATWAEEGKNGNKEFAKTVEGIKNGSITASDALDIFGTRAGPMLVDAIKSGKFEYQDMLKVIQNSKGTVDSTFDGTVDGGYKMELAMQNAKIALADVGDSLSTALVPLLESATSALKGFAEWWSGLDSGTQKTIITIAGVVAAVGPLLIIFGSVASGISKIITLTTTLKGVIAAAKAARVAATAATVANTAAEGACTVAKGASAGATTAATAAQWLLNAAMYACPIILIVALIAGLITGLVALVKNWDKVTAAVGKFGKGCKDVLGKVGKWFSDAWDNVKKRWSQAGEFFSGVLSRIKGVFSNVGSWFGQKFAQGKNAAVNAWSNVKSGFSNAWSRIKSVFSNVGGWFRNKFTQARNGITSVWSKLKLNMPKVKLPHFKIKGKFSLSPPSVPRLSVQWYKRGGIMTKPTIFGMNGPNFMAGGEAGPEAILPIDKLQGYVTTAVERSAPAIDLRPLVDAVEELAGRPINFNLNGRRFASATAGDTDKVNGMRNALTDRGLVLS